MSPRPAKHRFQLIERLRSARVSHRRRGRLIRSGSVIAAVFVIVAGLLMLVLPGPGVLVLAIGLYLLALEFDWAERLLKKALERADKTKDSSFVKGTVRFVKRRPKTTAALLAVVITATAVLVVSFWKPELFPNLITG